MRGRYGEVQARVLLLIGDGDLLIPSKGEGERLEKLLPRCVVKVRILILVGSGLPSDANPGGLARSIAPVTWHGRVSAFVAAAATSACNETATHAAARNLRMIDPRFSTSDE